MTKVNCIAYNEAIDYNNLAINEAHWNARKEWAITEILYAIAHTERYWSISKRLLRKFLENEDAEVLYNNVRHDLRCSDVFDPILYIDKYLRAIQRICLDSNSIQALLVGDTDHVGYV